MLRPLAQWVCAAVFLIAVFILVHWGTTSVVITGNGQVKWAEGFEEVKCYWLQCGAS